MSTHAGDEPTGHVRRKTTLPARYEDYDLTGFALPTLYTEPMSPHTQIPSKLSYAKEQEESPLAFSPLQIPGDELHSSEEWSDTDPSRSEKDKLKHRNRDLYHANGNMHHTVTVQMMQHERDALQQTNQQYAQELSQLKQQMQQLQIQVSQQHPVSRSPPSPITARQPHSGQ